MCGGATLEDTGGLVLLKKAVTCDRLGRFVSFWDTAALAGVLGVNISGESSISSSQASTDGMIVGGCGGWNAVLGTRVSRPGGP